MYITMDDQSVIDNYLTTLSGYDIEEIYRILNSFDDISKLTFDVDWRELTDLVSHIDEAFIDKYFTKIWKHINTQRPFSEGFIRKYYKYVDWKYISKYQYLSDDFLQEFGMLIHWNFMCIPYIYDEDGIVAGFHQEDGIGWMYRNYDFDLIDERRMQLSETIIRLFSNEVDWEVVSTYGNLSLDLVRDFDDKICWYRISLKSHYNQYLWLDFGHKLNWDVVFEAGAEEEGYGLRDEEIRIYSEVISWGSLMKFQTVNVELLREFRNKINWAEADQTTKVQLKEYIQSDHRKKTFILADETLDVPTEIFDHILSYL